MCNIKCVKYVFMSYQVIANIKMSDLVFTRQIIRLIMLVRNTGIDFFPYLNKWVKKTANQASFPSLKNKIFSDRTVLRDVFHKFSLQVLFFMNYVYLRMLIITHCVINMLIILKIF